MATESMSLLSVTVERKYLTQVNLEHSETGHFGTVRHYNEAEEWRLKKMKKCYASGEIDTEEFDRKKKDLE